MTKDLKREEDKSKGTQRLFSLLKDQVCHPEDVVTKAQLYDEAVAETRTITVLKLIHICVDYSAKLETILVEMRPLFLMLSQPTRQSPILLDKILDLTEFSNLPPTDVLQGLHTTTMLRINPDVVTPKPKKTQDSPLN